MLNRGGPHLIFQPGTRPKFTLFDQRRRSVFLCSRGKVGTDMMHDCFQKTEKGREEIATRKYGLSLRLHSILLLIDGKKTCHDLVQAYPGLGLSDILLSDLEQQGFISPLASSPDDAGQQVASAESDGPPLTADTCICTETEVTIEVQEPKSAAAYQPSTASLILNTIFPAEMPILPEELCDSAYMTAEDDYLKRPALHEPREEHPTLFDAIKSCYLNGLHGVPPDINAPLLKSIGNARTTKGLAELQPAFLKVLRAAKGRAAAVKLAEELELLLFACEA